MSLYLKIQLLVVAGWIVGFENQTPQPPVGSSDSAEPTWSEEAEAIWSRWIQRLDEADYMQLEERCSRVSSLAINGQPSEEIVEEHYILAKAFMAEDSFLLTVWETDVEWKPIQPNAVLVMAWANNTVTEKIWYPDLGQYRTKRFPSATHIGPRNTEHERGCQFGYLLSTWLGEGDLSVRGNQEYVKSIAEIIESDPDQSEHGLILKTETGRMIDAESGALEYLRIDELFYSTEAVLTRWITTVYQAMDDERLKPLRAHPDPYFIVQDSTWAIEFPDAAPPEYQQALDRMMQEEVSD